MKRADHIKTYYLKPSWRISMLVIGGLGIFLPVFFPLFVNRINKGSISSTFWDTLPVSLPFALIGLEIIYEAIRSRVIITDQGLTYYQPRYSVVAAWENIDRIEIANGSNNVILKQPALEANRFLAWLLLKLGNWDRIIPLGLYMYRAQDSELYREILKYAPPLNEGNLNV